MPPDPPSVFPRLLLQPPTFSSQPPTWNNSESPALGCTVHLQARVSWLREFLLNALLEMQQSLVWTAVKYCKFVHHSYHFPNVGHLTSFLQTEIERVRSTVDVNGWWTLFANVLLYTIDMTGHGRRAIIPLTNHIVGIDVTFDSLRMLSSWTDRPIPVRFGASAKHKKRSRMVKSGRTYRRHTVSCSFRETSVVSSANSEKHLALFTSVIIERCTTLLQAEMMSFCTCGDL